MDTNDFMEKKEFILKRKVNSRFLDIFKLIFIIFMFPYFILHRIFCNKISKMIFSKLFIILYVVCVILIGINLFNKTMTSKKNIDEYEKIIINFEDKIKSF